MIDAFAEVVYHVKNHFCLTSKLFLFNEYTIL